MSDQARQDSEGAASADDKSTEKSLVFEAQNLVTIKAGGKVFKIQKAILVKDSPYFEGALNGPFLEGQSQTIDFEDDIAPKDFSVYVESAYSLYFNKDFKPRRKVIGFISVILRLWVLADRFLNVRLQVLATEEMVRHFQNYTVEVWEKMYQTAGDPSVHSTSLQRIFNQCPLFSELHDTLDPDFRSAVTKKFIKRFEDPNLKRPLMDGEDTPVKRQKQD